MTATDTTTARYLIQNSREYVRNFDPVTGRVVWTDDLNAAMAFRTWEQATEMADGIGWVCRR